MKYLLLSGATGLVGRYLLRDLVSRDVPVAVLSRSSRAESATQRIEVLMDRWDRLTGRSLPRPVVIEADLRQPLLGTDESSRRWIAEHCDRILHNAASMTFREDKHGEPFRTNQEGMQNVLDLCRETGLRKFHHVSTAYICGLREGWIYENEIDLGQQNGNVYEVSKLAAEKLVRSAEFLDELTVYRPASVVGDSETGYTVSSHGFYLPLQLAFVIADKVPTELMGERFFRLLGLRGDEGKNLVPVDWLSAGIVHIVNNPALHGQTYHMTNPRPVTVRLIQQVVREAIEKHSARRFMGVLSEAEIKAFEELFCQYMDIYRSHWRDDPKFDRSNTDAALAHLPCPEIDYEMLLRIASFPVKEGFVLKKVEPLAAGFEVHAHLQRLVAAGAQHAGAAHVQSAPTSIGVEVTGSRGGQWRLSIHEGRVIRLDQGLGPANQLRYRLNSHTFSSLVHGQYSVEQCLRSGRVLVEGNVGDGQHQDCVRVLESIVSS